MAIAPVTLASGTGQTDTDAINYTTASVSPTPGRVVLLGISVYDAGGSLSGTPTCAGCGLTWARVDGGGNVNLRATVFAAYADPALVTAGTITVSGVVAVGQTADGAVWSIIEVDGVNPTTNNGVVQSNATTTTTDSVSVTLAAFASALNGTLGFVNAWDSAGLTLSAMAVGSGFTLVASSTIGNNPNMAATTNRILWEYRTDNDTTVDATAPAANDRMNIVGIELNGTPLGAVFPQAVPLVPVQ